jgi:septal ring factor EnvC (AmiA/AmiB activator)
MLLSKPILIAAAAALILLGAYAGWAQLKLSRAEVKVAQAEQLVQEANTARDLALAANQTNQDTIDRLQKEKLDIERSLAALEADRRRNAKVISDLSATIQAMAADPANQAPLSPVLRETVRQIQLNRQGGAK